MPREQIGVSLTAHERELIEAIAKEQGKSLAAVLRECAMEGIDVYIEKRERRKKYLKSQTDTLDK